MSAKPIVVRNLDDLGTPGVVVEVDPDEAEALGAFREDAMTSDDASDSIGAVHE